MKQRISLNEAQLHRIVKETVKNVLIQEGFGDKIQGAIQGYRQGAQSMDDMQQQNQQYNRTLNGHPYSNNESENIEDALKCLKGAMTKLYRLNINRDVLRTKYIQPIINVYNKIQELIYKKKEISFHI